MNSVRIYVNIYNQTQRIYKKIYPDTCELRVQHLSTHMTTSCVSTCNIYAYNVNSTNIYIRTRPRQDTHAYATQSYNQNSRVWKSLEDLKTSPTTYNMYAYHIQSHTRMNTYVYIYMYIYIYVIYIYVCTYIYI